MDGKQFSLITIGMIILLGIVGLGFMQMNTNNTLSTIANRLMVVEKQVQQESVKTTSTTATTEAGAPCKGDCDAGVVEYKDYKWDFSFKYPEDYFVVAMNDLDGSGRKGLIVTSQKGRLFLSSGGPAKPTAGQFVSGAEMRIEKLDNETILLDSTGDSKQKIIKTNNPLVVEFEDPCDGAGCPDKKYIITTKAGGYLASIWLTKDSDMEAILQTITE